MIIYSDTNFWLNEVSIYVTPLQNSIISILNILSKKGESYICEHNRSNTRSICTLKGISLIMVYHLILLASSISTFVCQFCNPCLSADIAALSKVSQLRVSIEAPITAITCAIVIGSNSNVQIS